MLHSGLKQLTFFVDLFFYYVHFIWLIIVLLEKKKQKSICGQWCAMWVCLDFSGDLNSSHVFSQNAIALSPIDTKALYIFRNFIGNSERGKNPYDLPTVCIKGQIKGLLHRTGHNPFFKPRAQKRILVS